MRKGAMQHRVDELRQQLISTSSPSTNSHTDNSSGNNSTPVAQDKSVTPTKRKVHRTKDGRLVMTKATPTRRAPPPTTTTPTTSSQWKPTKRPTSHHHHHHHISSTSTSSPGTGLDQSSMIDRTKLHKKENAPTDVEWHTVARVLSDLRSHTLRATSAFAGRYAKQTTDTDVWAWKQTTDWENRKTIRRYLDNIDLDRAAEAVAAATTNGDKRSILTRRPSSAPMRRNRASVNPTGQQTRQRLNSRRRPSTATVRRGHRAVVGKRRSSSSSTTSTTSTTSSTSSFHRPPLPPVTTRYAEKSKREAATPPRQTAGEWVVGLARGALDISPGKKYHISRRRKKRIVVVTHKDDLVLERVAFSNKRKEQQRSEARRNFEHLVRVNGLST